MELNIIPATLIQSRLYQKFIFFAIIEQVKVDVRICMQCPCCSLMLAEDQRHRHHRSKSTNVEHPSVSQSRRQKQKRNPSLNLTSKYPVYQHRTERVCRTFLQRDCKEPKRRVRHVENLSNLTTCQTLTA